MTRGIDVQGLNAVFELLKATQVQWNDEASKSFIVAPTVSYAVYQEKGTSDIEARPYMRPAARRVDQNTQAMLERYQSPSAGPVETLAIAVQDQAKTIADRKGVRDTGALINSITYEEL